jgi:tetratricopeptide (TPR) repeat protein
VSTHLGLLADAYRSVNRPEEGLSAVDEALAFARETGKRFVEAELYRLRGELQLQRSRLQPRVPAVRRRRGHVVRASGSDARGSESQAEACFLEAIEIASGQHAKAFELRAASSLARLWRRRGRKAEARKMLAEIYGWFSEGFDAGDLVEAKTLLDELS